MFILWQTLSTKVYIKYIKYNYIHTNFLTTTIGSLWSKMVFILMNVWMIEKNFYSHLNVKDNTDAEFEMKKIGEYHGLFRRIYNDLYVQSNTLLLSDVFKNFQNMCLNMNGKQL